MRYPGGKSRACVKMNQYFPDLRNYREYREGFLGGGSVAIHITKKYPNLDIWVNDLYEPLYNFWKVLQDKTLGYKMYKRLQELKSRYPDEGSARGLFLEAKGLVNDNSVSPLFRACSFYVINKCSFSGLTESSSFSKQASIGNFTMRGIDKLPGYTQLIRNWKITNHSYEELMKHSESAFLYLDPPYDIKDNIYGKKGSMHKSFSHDEFAKNCNECSANMLVSYNSAQLVKDRFEGWTAAEFDLTYTMRSVGEYMREQKERKELLLMNYEKEKSLEDLGKGARREAGVK